MILTERTYTLCSLLTSLWRGKWTSKATQGFRPDFLCNLMGSFELTFRPFFELSHPASIAKRQLEGWPDMYFGSSYPTEEQWDLREISDVIVCITNPRPTFDHAVHPSSCISIWIALV